MIKPKRDMLGAVVAIALLVIAVHDVYVEEYINAIVDVALALLLTIGPSYARGDK